MCLVFKNERKEADKTHDRVRRIFAVRGDKESRTLRRAFRKSVERLPRMSRKRAFLLLLLQIK